jgi:hypothetical protein
MIPEELARAFILATARKHAALLRTRDKRFKGPEEVEYVEVQGI